LGQDGAEDFVSHLTTTIALPAFSAGGHTAGSDKPA